MNSATQSFLGRYRLVKVLGQGAMGVVYEAVDTRLNRTVAIKTVLRSHLADETTANEYATRFEREAQAAARLAHPHVVTVYDFGEHEDISYIVMEFVRGRELNQAFEAGERFPLPEAVRIMRELLQALDYAHQQGIVHRDIKPANVMLDAGGHVKLTDFGVARVANANQDRTMPGTLVGTPSYMSPEQILGLAVGSRADIFAAGVILYQFLTGKRPFSGGGPFGVQRKIVQDDPEPPSQANPELPPGFDIIIARALAKQPEDRYETAAAFAIDLERIGAALPREVPLIDLDFSGSPAPAAPAPAAAPAQSPAPAPNLNLLTDLPLVAPGGPRTPAPDGDGLPPDPEATVIMFRPTAPEPPARRPPAPPPATSAPPPPAPPPTQQIPPPRPPAAPPAPRPMPSAAEMMAASPPTMAVPRMPSPTPGVHRSHQPAGRGPGVGAAPAPAARPARSAARSTLMPVAAGAGVALLVLAAWLLVARPWADGKGPAPLPAPTPQSADPAPSPAPAATPTAAPEPAPAPATPVNTVTPAPSSMPSPPPAEAAPAPAPEPAPVRPPPRRQTPAAEASPRPPARGEPRPEPRSSLEPRCSDLLQRMQLGEPLSTEQTMFFQTRCTR
ncbi:MAG: serine/threonine-protein kinase [Rubrivivax sp.]